MYETWKDGKMRLEADACGIGFVATRKGVPDRRIVDLALELCLHFDHRGAPGHGAGMQLDIPWPLLLDRFPHYAKAIAARDVALAMVFLPFDGTLRRRCVEEMERLANLAGAPILQWADVPTDLSSLPKGSPAARSAPVVRQALLKRPAHLSEEGWFAARYLLRLAIDSALAPVAGDECCLVSLSNRTVVYKGLSELSRIRELYPDLDHPDFASRFVNFHSRYCTNTTTAWRRAQPFWSLAHNGEISTVKGNVAWMEAIGKDLIGRLVRRNPGLRELGREVESVICQNGSDTAALDDMMIALMAGGMSLTEAMLALLPPADLEGGAGSLSPFLSAMNVYLGACDGPAAIVASDGDDAVAHLDRNGLRPLWFAADDEIAVAASELPGGFPSGELRVQRLLGPGETVVVRLGTGEILLDEAVRRVVAARPRIAVQELGFPDPVVLREPETESLRRAQRAFGMGKEDIDVVLKPLAETGKPALGAMGDDTSPAALLDLLPRRLEDHFALRFAQETSPPVDPIRDAWVFDPSVALGDRSGLWDGGGRGVFRMADRVLARADSAALRRHPDVHTLPLHFAVAEGSAGLEARLEALVSEGLASTERFIVIALSDEGIDGTRAGVPAPRAVSRLHTALVRAGLRHRVGLMVHTGAWDIHHVAILVALGADAVCPWLGAATVGPDYEANYLKGLRSGLVEAMSMMGVTPSSAYCGARLIEAVGLEAGFLAREFPGVPGHLGGIGPETLDAEWIAFHRSAYGGDPTLPDFGEFRHSKEGRPHANNADLVRNLQGASGFARKIHLAPPGTWEAYAAYAGLVSGRSPISILDLVAVRDGDPMPIEEVESVERIAWRFMAPGMSEGALSEPAHRAVAHALNLLRRYCRLYGGEMPPGIGPIANSGEGGFDKRRIGTREANRSIQYAGGRFTVTPLTAATALEAEVKFAQGAKPGKGGQLPGKKVTAEVAARRGCEPGYELVSPPINHNLYSIEDVKLMVESWRHLNPKVNCALKYVATYGVEMVVLGGVNAGANRLHLSDGCGGTGAAKRVDQKHAGVPLAAVLPKVQDTLVEEGVRHLVEISVDGGVQSGEGVLKLFLLGADRVGFGTSLLVAIGCSMLRKCHLAGPDPADPTGKRRLGCTPGIATQDPVHLARFAGKPKHIARYLLFTAREVRERLAAAGVRSVGEIVGRRDLLEAKPDLTGKANLLRLDTLLGAPHAFVPHRDYAAQTRLHLPALRETERAAALRAIAGEDVPLAETISNEDRCVGLAAAGEIARTHGDQGLAAGSVRFEHAGAAGHFYAAYAVNGLVFRLKGLTADSCFTAAVGGTLVVVPEGGGGELTLVGNAFGYGARGGSAFIAGRGGNRFGICLRTDAATGGARIVVEGVEANAFQYMTGGVAVVLGTTGPNLGSGMTGGRIYLLDCDPAALNATYVHALPLDVADEEELRRLLQRHVAETASPKAAGILATGTLARFRKVVTRLLPEDWAA